MRRHRHAGRESDQFLYFDQMVREGQAAHLIHEHGFTFRFSNPPVKAERERLHARDHRQASKEKAS